MIDGSKRKLRFSLYPSLHGLRERGHKLLDVCYPRRCEGCQQSVDTVGGYLCWDCLSAADYIKSPYCSLCGDPVDGMVEHDFACSWCRRTDPWFDKARSVIRFRGSMRDAIHRFKYNRATHLADDFARLLAGCVNANFSDQLIDSVACVPLHPVKARERSYNQSCLLAKALGRHLTIPVASRVLARTQFTSTQTRLNADERKRNVRGAFKVAMPDWVDGRRWLLIDDVMTTGATVDECSRVLKEAGAVSVSVVTLARG
jgi:competence protein ComFC